MDYDNEYDEYDDTVPRWVPRSQNPLAFAAFGIKLFLGSSAVLLVVAVLVARAF